MDPKQIVILALQVSILCAVFGFGLKTTYGDMLYLVQRPGLFVRSILAVFVIMPVVAVALSRMFDFSPTVEIALVALSISPVPPLLPKKETKAGGDTAFGLSLMAWLALLSIVAVPVALELLKRLYGRQLGIAPGTIARVVLTSTLAPLAAGMGVRAVWPSIAARLEKPVTLISAVLLSLASLVLLVASAPAIWARVGDGTVVAIVIFTVVGLAIGHVLGGPHPDHSAVLALSTACRHPAIALAVASANFPDQRFGATILLYLLVNALVGVPYVKRQGRHAIGAVSKV
jgi:BASS family bile acid:Na+ symporter